MVFLSTVWHSGTHSLKVAIEKAGEKDIYWQHCDTSAVPKCQMPIYRWVATTLRDPYRVAASWYNRGEFPDLCPSGDWLEQWKCWGEIALFDKTRVFNLSSLAKANSSPDVYGLHAALDRGDMKAYHRHIPRKYTDFALNLTAEAQRVKFVETHSDE